MVNPDSAYLCDASRDEIEEEANGKDQLNCPSVYLRLPSGPLTALNHRTTNQPTARR